MPYIRPISDLRNNFNEIAEICHQEGEPVFITKNGHGDLVVMSVALYEKQQALLELYAKLAEAEVESKSKAPKVSHAEVMRSMREKLNEQ
ncbi:type II toxin-antitoxin system Phd/YefM family antitoxin [Brevibacillus sp. SYP-B805]|uniref:type II toxin-antitoxin system prevent-host-death family antitoxin n=1 Tax=Brevibacillus sp. SYP-B805 TaxID=1578199 RepID=UPI0013ECE047|nr:type II toxin-antitoxin system prevent-host-death family antitoxin [Brevibacillus sp. SYP-B805]NGQ96119.1 type II toxin-antitoxin system Phd/YefM family antitoxin [Brevibacillus sp. SYP-B805]